MHLCNVILCLITKGITTCLSDILLFRSRALKNDIEFIIKLVVYYHSCQCYKAIFGVNSVEFLKDSADSGLNYAKIKFMTFMTGVYVTLFKS